VKSNAAPRRRSARRSPLLRNWFQKKDGKIAIVVTCH
jgi:hypothetical protein